MRLSLHSRALIRAAVTEIFGADATVKAFGSRLDENALGGDIDLLVEVSRPIADRERKILQLTSRLQMRLGDQPIDVLVLDPATPRTSIYDQALLTGELI